jgi:2-desacetyl-2-hydroxyethyl bacteriochlorophyllide A dehydrogenase
MNDIDIALYFVAQRSVDVRQIKIGVPGPGQVRVRTVCSAISPGTELLIYRGEAPHALVADSTLSALSGSLNFPLKYGYACVGDVEALGTGVSSDWLGRRVFAFNPHESRFLVHVDALHVVPSGVDLDDAVFLPNMESAVNFVQDARPLLGEVAAVLGQGVVGLLTTALLARMPLARLIGVDRVPLRREWSRRMGANTVIDATDIGAHAEQADVCFELSGAPQALDGAISLTGFGGRVLIGSWYGAKPVTVDLGGRFHRSRIQLIASQVSTLDAALGARWDKARRLDMAWRMLREVRPAQLITHRLPPARAAQAYQLLDQAPGEAVQVVFDWAASAVQ